MAIPSMSGTRPFAAASAVALHLVRRGGVILAVVVGGYLALKVASYLATYPDAASRARLAAFDNPAVRMLQGVPVGVDTPGGFTVWDGGYVAEAVVGVWALLTTTRLLRGEEEAQRSQFVLAAPIGPGRTTASYLLVLFAAALLQGVAAAAGLRLAGADLAGSILFSVALVGFAATFIGVAAVVSQLYAERRRAVRTTAALFGVSYLVRVVGCSTDSRGWLRWLTPFGWVDELRPYTDPRWVALVPLLSAPPALAAVAVWLRGRRDDGAGLVVARDHARGGLRLLGGPLALAWRSSRGVLLGWMLGLGAYAFLIGALLKSMVDFLVGDENYRRILAQLNMDLTHPDSFVAVMGGVLGVGFALYACWRIGAARAEEDAALLENLLVRPVTRWRWIRGELVVTAVGTVALAIGCGGAMWAGAALTGAGVTPWGAVQAMLATLPAVVVSAGLAVALFGLVPRLTVPMSVGLTLAAYLLQLIGPALHWPGWVVGLSPFHYLAQVPAEPFRWGSTSALLAVGCALTLAGVTAFRQRDLVGA